MSHAVAHAEPLGGLAEEDADKRVRGQRLLKAVCHLTLASGLLLPQQLRYRAMLRLLRLHPSPKAPLLLNVLLLLWLVVLNAPPSPPPPLAPPLEGAARTDTPQSTDGRDRNADRVEP
eukprot:1194852-Prorocentrum_minimum.AAC.2